MKRSGKVRKRLSRLVRKGIAFLFLLVSLSTAYLCIYGFPRWLVVQCRSLINSSSGNFAIEPGAVRLDIMNGLIMADTRVYRKGVVGPPMVEAGEIIVAIDPLFFLRRKGFMKSVSVKGGLFRPEMASGPSSVEKRGRLAPLYFGVELTGCEMLGLVIDSLTFELNAGGSELSMDNISCLIKSPSDEGSFRGKLSVNMVTGELDAQLETRMDPHLLMPLVRYYKMEFSEELINRFVFSKAAPRVELKIRREAGEISGPVVTGHYWFQDGSYRGVDLLRADGGLEIRYTGDESLLRLDPIFLVRREGNARVVVEYDSAAELVDFNGTSTLDPIALTRMIGILTNGFMDEVTCNGPVNVIGAGKVDVGEGYARTAMDIGIDSRGLEFYGFASETCSFNINVRGNTNSITGLKSRIYGGDLEGNADFISGVGTDTNVYYKVYAVVREAGFADVAKALSFPEKDYKGSLTGGVDVEGVIGRPETAIGQGSMRIKDGRVLMLPLFGGLSKVMAKVIPGLDFVLRQSDARAKFVIKDGKVSSDKVSIMGDVLSLDGKGDYYLDGRMDYTVQVKLMKDSRRVGDAIVRGLTWIFSKLFEFELTGTVDDPKWEPFAGTKDILSSIGLGGKEPDKKPDKSGNGENDPAPAPEEDE